MSEENRKRAEKIVLDATKAQDAFNEILHALDEAEQRGRDRGLDDAMKACHSDWRMGIPPQGIEYQTTWKLIQLISNLKRSTERGKEV